MSRLENLSRRHFVSGVTVLCTDWVVNGNPSFAMQGGTQRPPYAQNTSCYSTFDQVRTRVVSPAAYLQERVKCLPEVAAAQRAGMLGGFLYTPSDKELETVLTKLFSDRATNNGQLNYLVRSSASAYKSALQTERNTVKIVVPGIIGVFGQRIPVYLAFNENLFFSSEVKNDADVGSIAAKHAIRHVKDWYGGIQLGSSYLSHSTLSPRNFTIKFLEQIMELRAVYDELEEIFKERVGTGKVSVSTEWLGSQLGNYAEHWKFVKTKPSTELEKQASGEQLRQFKGIVPEETGDKAIIHFDLFGKRNSAGITRKQKSN